MSEKMPSAAEFLKFIFLYTLLDVMYKECGFSTGVVNKLP